VTASAAPFKFAKAVSGLFSDASYNAEPARCQSREHWGKLAFASADSGDAMAGHIHGNRGSIGRQGKDFRQNVLNWAQRLNGLNVLKPG